MRLSDSGVVTSAAGQRRSCRARSAAGVSPVRMPTDQPGASAASGACKARTLSAANARIGVIHSTCKGGAPRAAAGCRRARSRAPSHTA